MCRVLASIRDGHVRLLSRNGHSFTNLFGPVSDTLRGFPTSILLDGEVIVINDKGQPGQFPIPRLEPCLQRLEVWAISATWFLTACT
jgi:hypothetical protein